MTQTEDSSYTEFKKAVNKLAEKKDDFKIHHVGPESSAIVLGSIFKYSKNSLRLYVGDFNGDISNDERYLKYLKEFIQKGGKLRVIVNKVHVTPSKAYELVSMHDGFGDNVQMLEHDCTNSFESDIHFAIGDDHIYRIEVNTDEYVGVASFNDPETCQELIEKFDKLFEEELEKKNKENHSYH